MSKKLSVSGWIGGLAALVAAMTSSLAAQSPFTAFGNPPLVALLAPADGRALNADSLRVQALIAEGRNIGRIRLVELALDGAIVGRFNPQPCRRHVLVDFKVDLTVLAPGPHSLMVTAYASDPRSTNAQSAGAIFTLDPTLPFAETNEVEELLVPEPFACFTVRDPLQAPDRDDDDDDGDDDKPWRRPNPFRIGGTLVTGLQSDRIDLTRDRIVIAVGPDVAIVEPGDLRCHERGRDRIACRFADRSNPLVQRLDIRQKRNGRWQFEIAGGPLPADADAFYLGIGNDWGGVDLATGDRIAALRIDRDAGHQAQAVVGPDGGTVETTDALGVRLRLDVPMDALSADTLITMTPLASSPLADSSAALHPGVKFEPEGLAFGMPATLTVDFSQTGQSIGAGHFVFLITSPLGALPLLGTRDAEARILTAQIPHFTAAQPSPPVSTTSDFALVRQIVSQTGTLSVSAIRNLLAYDAVWREQIQLGTLQGISEADAWILIGEVETKSLASLDTHIANEVMLPESAVGLSGPMGDPAREGVAERLIELEAMRQTLNAPQGSAPSCYIHQNLEARINRAASSTTPITPERRVRSLLKLAALAQAIGMFDLSSLAQGKIGGFLRSLLAQGVQTCQTDKTAGLAILDPLLPLALKSQVKTIDPTLATAVQSAIATCGVTSSITIKKGTTTQVFGANLEGTGIRWREVNENEDAICCIGVVLAGDQPPPVNLGSGGRTLKITEPSADVLVIEMTGSTSPQFYAGSFTVRAEMAFTKAGSLEMKIDPAWFSGGLSGLGWTLDSGESGFCSNTSAGLNCSPVGSATIPIAQPGTRVVDVRAAVSSGTVTGRAMTITFTPQ